MFDIEQAIRRVQQVIPPAIRFGLTMADTVTSQIRSRMMSNIRSSGTLPERLVQDALAANGISFTTIANELPGKPDIMIIDHRSIVFVHGCFWHLHDCKKGRSTPQTNAEFWLRKRQRTMERDEENVSALQELGFRVLTVWECQAKDHRTLQALINNWFGL